MTQEATSRSNTSFLGLATWKTSEWCLEGLDSTTEGWELPVLGGIQRKLTSNSRALSLWCRGSNPQSPSSPEARCWMAWQQYRSKGIYTQLFIGHRHPFFIIIKADKGLFWCCGFSGFSQEAVGVYLVLSPPHKMLSESLSLTCVKKPYETLENISYKHNMNKNTL